MNVFLNDEMKRFNEMIGNLCVASRFRRILISIRENSMGFYYIDLWGSFHGVHTFLCGLLFWKDLTIGFCNNNK